MQSSWDSTRDNFFLNKENLLSLEKEALKCVSELGKLARCYFHQSLEPTLKPDRSLVSLADQAVEDRARELLKKVTPQWGFYGEERGAIKYLDEREDPHELDVFSDTYWILDPIDGTTNFLSSSPLWSTLLALIHKGEPVLGICALPCLDEVFIASKGNGARMGSLSESAVLRSCFLRPVSSLRQARTSATNARVFDLRGVAGLLPVMASHSGEWRTHSDAYGYTRVLCGGIQLMCDPLVMPYDVAALQILFDETPGACFGTWHGIEGPLRWLGGSAWGSASSQLADGFLDLIRRHMMADAGAFSWHVGEGGQGVSSADGVVPRASWGQQAGVYSHDIEPFNQEHLVKKIMASRERVVAAFLGSQGAKCGVLEATLGVHPQQPGLFRYFITVQKKDAETTTSRNSWGTYSSLSGTFFAHSAALFERRLGNVLAQAAASVTFGDSSGAVVCPAFDEGRLLTQFYTGPCSLTKQVNMPVAEGNHQGWVYSGLSCCSWSFDDKVVKA